MWCKNCRQDVPGIVVADGGADRSAPPADGFVLGVANLSDLTSPASPISAQHATRFVCARCHQPLGADEDAASERSESQFSSTVAQENAPSNFETWQWELDQELHDVRRLLEANAPRTAPNAVAFDEATVIPTPHFATRHRDDDLLGSRDEERRVQHEIHPPHHRTTRKPRKPRPATLAWFVLSLGLMALVCGGVLLGWSVVTARQELWQLGLPIAVGGQAVMLVGLLLLLERMWRDNHTASEKLERVDDQIDDLRHTTTILGNSQGGGSRSFYTHMAEGAHPSLLLSDLKSQLDALAVKISDR